MAESTPAAGPRSSPLRLAHWPLDLLRTLLRVLPPASDRSIAYRVLFALVPLSIVLVAIFGIVLRNDDLRYDVIKEIVDTLPLSDQGTANVTHEIERLASPASGL